VGSGPEPDDPLFFESSVAVPQFLSDEPTDEIWKSLLQAAGDSGIDPRRLSVGDSNILKHDLG
jgi:hypothetical protein